MADTNGSNDTMRKGYAKRNAKMRRARKIRLIVKFCTIVILTALASVSVLGFMSYNQYQEMKERVDTDRIYKNIYVNDVNIGGLTKDEAFDRLYSELQGDLDEKEIILYVDDYQMPLKYKDFGIKYDFAGAIDEAFRYARDGNLKQRNDKVAALDKQPHKFTYALEYIYKIATIEELITPFAEVVNVAPKNASIARVNGEMIISAGRYGWELDIEKTAERIEEYIIRNDEGMVEGIMSEIAPMYTEADLANSQTLIGSYTTEFSPGENGRNENIKNALSKINNTVLYPDEVFSTIKLFGEMTYDNGYRLAPEIVNGKLVDGYGGGVCQVSSTLYNAVLLAELEVVERRNHSLKVGYLDYAFDAMIAGDYFDFRFKNNTPYPLIVEAYVANGKTAVTKIYGYEVHGPGRKVEFANEFVSKIDPAADIEIPDSSRPLGERVVIAAAKPGYRYNLYKTVYEDGEFVSKDFINQSTYRATPGEVLVGTAEVIKEEATPEPLKPPSTDYQPFIFNTN